MKRILCGAVGLVCWMTPATADTLKQILMETGHNETAASWMASIAEKAIEAGEPGEPIEAWPPSLNEDQVPIHVGEPLDIDDAFAIPN